MTQQVYNRITGDGIDGSREGTLDLDDDEAQHNQRNRSGFAFVPKQTLEGVACRISANSEGLITAYLATGSGTVLERQTVATLDPGETFTFESTLEADETYWVLCDAVGRRFVRGRAEVEYPFENDLLTVTHGIYAGDGAESDSYRYCIDRLGPVGGSEPAGAIDLGSDDQGQSWRTLVDPSGVRVRTSEAVDGLRCRLSESTEGVFTGYLTTDEGDVLERQTVAAFDPGDTVAFETELEADETYRIVFDARGRSYVRGRAAIEYPVESDRLNVTHGIYGGDERSDDYRYCIDRILPGGARAHSPSGSGDDAESDDEDADTLELGADEEAQSWNSLADPSGVRFRTDADVGDVTCRLSAETGGVTTATLTDDAGEVLEEVSIADLEAGDAFAFETDLEAGETYRVLCDAGGESYVRGRTGADYPIASDVLEATHGIYSGDYESDGYRYCVDRITVSIAETTTAELEEDDSEEPEPTTSTVDLGGDEEGQSWDSLDDPSGVRFLANADIERLSCRISSETADLTRAQLTDDDEAVLEEVSIADLEAGDAFTFEADLEAGEAYRVLVDADGEPFVRGRTAAEFPFEDDLLAVTNGIYGGYLESDGYRYCVDRITAESAGVGSSSTEIEREESELDLGSDEEAQSWSSLERPSGLRLRAEADVDALECRISAETEGLTAARLVDDGGEVLEEASIADLEAGDAFAFEAGLEAGEAYRVLVDAGGESYVRGRAAAEFPFEDDLLAVTDGIYGGSYRSESYRYCLDRVVAEREYEVSVYDGESEADGGSDHEVATLELGADEEGQSWSSLDDPSGVRFRAEAPIHTLECRLSAESGGLTRARLTDDGGEVLAERSIADLEADDTFVLAGDLSAETAYRVVCDADGEPYVRGRTEIEYPIESDALEATHGIYGGDLESESYRYCLDRIEPTEPVESESATEPVPTSSASTHGLMAELTTRPDDVTTVDVTAEPSIDENGDLSAEILAFLDSRDRVNHEFVLPMGSYTWNTEFVVFDPIEYLEIRGEPRATLEIRDHGVGIAFLFGRWATDDPPKHVALRNLDVDIDDRSERDAGLISAHVGRCLLDNVELVGERWRHGPQGGDRYTCMINTRDPSALSLIRNLGLPDGEVADSSQPSVGHSIGCSADPPHQGINIWDRCYVEDYVDNGIYVRNSDGENVVEHSITVNCGNGNIRLGAADQARDCKILLDRGSDRTYPGAGLWLNGGKAIAERIEIDGSDAQNDIVRINSDADGEHIKGLDLFCGPDVQAPAIRCTETSTTTNLGLLIEDFEVEDLSTAAGGSVRVQRSDVTLKDGVVDASYRPALTGYGNPDLEDVDLS